MTNRTSVPLRHVTLGLLALGLAILVAAGDFLSGFWDQETRVERYRTAAEAREGGAERRGLVPALLPASARDVVSVHDVDTGEHWLEFHADTAEVRHVVASLRLLSFDEARQRAPRPPRRKNVIELPPALRQGSQQTSEGAWSTGFYRDDARAYCLAVIWHSGRAFGWPCARLAPPAAAS